MPLDENSTPEELRAELDRLFQQVATATGSNTSDVEQAFVRLTAAAPSEAEMQMLINEMERRHKRRIRSLVFDGILLIIMISSSVALIVNHNSIALATCGFIGMFFSVKNLLELRNLKRSRTSQLYF